MIRYRELTHRFVGFIPELIEPGILYVSTEYATAVHACCCGCGKEVVTPFTPTDWKMTFDGETISLWPSVGNWRFPCRSHYVLKENRAIESSNWSDEEVAVELQRDEAAKGTFYGRMESETADPANQPNEWVPATSKGFWSRITKWFAG